MKKFFLLAAAAASLMTMPSCAPDTAVAEVTGLAAYVDPYIGSGGHGHVFVGASVPFGAIQAGPQNIHKGWDWCSGYHYSDSIIIGFSHTHLSGTGCADLGDILIMPYSGEMRTKRGTQENIEGTASSYYNHDNEQVSPGYYSLLMDNGVKAEMTTTERVAMHRITYSTESENRLLINLLEGNGDRPVETFIRKVDEYTFEGYRISRGWSPLHKVFFTLVTDTPVESFNVFDNDEPAEGAELKAKGVKAVLTFKKGTKQVKAKVAISSVSTENAMANLNAEMPAWDFKNVQAAAINKWNEQLASITIDTKDERAKRIFYTAMFHSFIAPTLYCDVNGQFRGANDSIITADWDNYSTFSLWDTYRTLNPLFTIIKTDKVADFVNSKLSIFEQQGKLPIWHLLGGETNCMPGYSAIPIIADAYLKGIAGFDAERAFNYMKASATYEKQVGVPYVMERGFIPADKVWEATSIAMEYAVGDWGIAQMAKRMGKNEEYDEFLKRGKYYARYFDKSINFIRPVMENGKFLTPYDPFQSIHGKGYFCEGNGWQYTFFAPQDPEGLISLFGGDAQFTAKLDSFFVAEGDMGEEASADISGLIGMYAHGNEPSHHIAYLYPYAGEQWKAAEKVRFVQKEFYTDQPDGIIGNEDCGQMSAWHIMSALGFYQVNPSNGIFVFGSPLFEKATINLPGGKTFVVEAPGNSDENIYIQSALLNGEPYSKSFITYSDIMNGGTLSFVMGNTPNKEFGTAPENRPKTEI